MALFETYILWYDTECTTNVNTDARVISIGARMTKYDPVQKEFKCLCPGFHSYVYSDRESDAAAFAVHKITNDKLMNAPRFPEAIQLLSDYIKPFVTSRVRIYLAAHNGFGFDNVVMFCNCAIHRLNFEQFLTENRIEGFIDSLPLFRNVFKNRPEEECPKDPVTGRGSYALGICYQSWCNKAELEGAHDALVDTQALIDVCNSPTVSKLLTMGSLLSKPSYRKRTDGLKQIRQTAGPKFQQDQDRAKYQNAPMEVPALTDQPIWDAEGRFCLNCVSFTPHERCDVPTVSVA